MPTCLRIRQANHLTRAEQTENDVRARKFTATIARWRRGRQRRRRRPWYSTQYGAVVSRLNCWRVRATMTCRDAQSLSGQHCVVSCTARIDVRSRRRRAILINARGFFTMRRRARRHARGTYGP